MIQALGSQLHDSKETSSATATSSLEPVLACLLMRDCRGHFWPGGRRRKRAVWLRHPGRSARWRCGPPQWRSPPKIHSTSRRCSSTTSFDKLKMRAALIRRLLDGGVARALDQAPILAALDREAPSNLAECRLDHLFLPSSRAASATRSCTFAEARTCPSASINATRLCPASFWVPS